MSIGEWSLTTENKERGLLREAVIRLFCGLKGYLPVQNLPDFDETTVDDRRQPKRRSFTVFSKVPAGVKAFRKREIHVPRGRRVCGQEIFSRMPVARQSKNETF